jgi:lipopolysaccharide transport system ATP-binding protein
MAGDVVIRAEELGKKYIIGHETERQRYTVLRDVAARTVRHMWRRAVDAARGRGLVRGEVTEEFWALKDVSFDVKRGEVLGIIGRNGAGKSTLLKILSRITEPSKGRVTIAGRVASLLEVGTGFHPELTGRENIYLNGAILGMSRAEIRGKFDEIVDFSGVEKFIDTPVKRYSSGMQVRLAFSVAAHLEPEILVVDEVLAVGDIEFQKKCLGKMGEVSAREGRTVLFVSHNMDALRRCCQTGLLLSEGRVVTNATIGECIETYLHRLKPVTSESRLCFPPGKPDRHHIIDVEILDDQLRPISSPATWQSVVFAIRFYSPAPTPRASVTFQISTTEGNLLTFFSTKPDQNFDINFESGENMVYLRIGSLALSAGSYVIGAGLAIPNSAWLYNEPHGAIMEVVPRDVYGAGQSPTRRRYPVPMSGCWETPLQGKQALRSLTEDVM